MQFTTSSWSTFTNALIISTVALLSMIQAANAIAELYIQGYGGEWGVGPNFPGSPLLIEL